MKTEQIQHTLPAASTSRKATSITALHWHRLPVHLLMLILLTIGGLLGWALVQPQLTTTNVPRAEGFFATEESPIVAFPFRWMQERGVLHLPAGQPQGQLSVQLGAFLDEPQPVSVYLPHTDQTLAFKVAPGAARTYHLLLDNRETLARAILTPEAVIHAPVVPQDDNFARPLSIYFSAATFTATHPAGWLQTPLWWAGVAVAVTIYLLGAAAGLSWQRAGGIALIGLTLLLTGLLLAPTVAWPLTLALVRSLPLLLLLLLVWAIWQLHWWVGLALAVGLLLWGALPWYWSVWISDDAFISFRYAHNLLAGHGLVYNPGERVEGYTNFLWMLLSVPVQALGGDVELTALLLTSLLGAGLLLLTYALARQLLPTAPRLLALLAPLLLVLHASFAAYTIRGSGMETALFTTGLLLGALLYLREHTTWAGLVFGLTALVRPEGVLVFGLTFLHLLLVNWRTLRTVTTLRQVGWFCGAFLLVFLPYFSWRLGYYGDLLPNTFYAKTGATLAQVQRGLLYVGGFALTLGPLWLLLAFGAVWWHQLQRAYRSQVAYLVGLTLVYIGYIAAVGGDFFPAYRFFVPLLPLLAVLAVLGTAQVVQRLSQWQLGRFLLPGTLLLVGLLAFPVGGQFFDKDAQDYLANEHRVALYWGKVGRWLHTHAPPEASVAVEGAGAIAYYSELESIDMLGLNDRHISRVPTSNIGSGRAGHEKTDYPYVLARRPTYIPVQWATELETLPNFAELYAPLTVQLDPEDQVELYQLRR